eukprot:6726489-Ditylum_brightwellii.AAC.1
MGHPDATVPAVSNHKTHLQEVGLELNEDKTSCYIAERYGNNSYRCMLGEMSEGMLQTDERLPVYGLKAYGVPIGDNTYIREFLRVKGKKFQGKMERIEQKLHFSQFPEPQLPVRQCLW